MISLNEIIAEMKESNLIVEARRIEKIISNNHTYADEDKFYHTVASLTTYSKEGEKIFEQYPGGIDAFFAASDRQQFHYIFSKAYGEDYEEIQTYPVNLPEDNKYEITYKGENYILVTNDRNKEVRYAIIWREIPLEEYDDFESLKASYT